MLPRTLSVEEAANHFNVLPCTIRAWIKRGRLSATKIGKQYYIPEPEMEKMLMVDKPAVKEAKLSHTESINLMYQLQRESAAAGITSASLARALADMDAREDEAGEELRGMTSGGCS